jgi:CDGSH-type Zn-finger protein
LRAGRPVRRVWHERGGPVLIEGPVEIVGEDGRAIRSDRPVVALCTCRRSKLFPFCDTSHRRPTLRKFSEGDAQ